MKRIIMVVALCFIGLAAMAQTGNITVKLRIDSISFIPDGPFSCEDSVLILPLTFNQFAEDATLEEGSITSICVNMEHSFLGDFSIKIKCPDGKIAELKTRGGGGVFLGSPADFTGSDFSNLCTAPPNIPGTGWTYCFSELYPYSIDTVIVGTRTQIEITTHFMNTSVADDFPSVSPMVSVNDNNTTGMSIDSTRLADTSHYFKPWNEFSTLTGCPLNGEWQLIIQDYWQVDNGFVFWWDMELSGMQTNALSYIDNENSAIVNLYPNPAESYLEVISSTNISKVEIFNIIGQKVFETNASTSTISINIENLKGGNYIMKIYDDGGVTTKKVVIK
ncbi:MAG: T9SS type A sorting domain-containing protein [Bacteroidales bacterium]|jgi:subtilisin-like proprotein convertase family protein|nr:T9SS type A sorting domain-containing protein [Bacteroidales bacterium]